MHRLTVGVECLSTTTLMMHTEPSIGFNQQLFTMLISLRQNKIHEKGQKYKKQTNKKMHCTVQYIRGILYNHFTHINITSIRLQSLPLKRLLQQNMCERLEQYHYYAICLLY